MPAKRRGWLAAFTLLAWGMIVPGVFSAIAKPVFKMSEIVGRSADIQFCDLDGDHLADAVLVDGSDVSVYFQEAGLGFSREPQIHFSLGDRPCILWSARLDRAADSLLMMTSEGVTELCFTNRSAPPLRRQIIQQPTVVPATLKDPTALFVPMSARAGSGCPLVLVPSAAGLQIWRHRDAWEQGQILGQTVADHLQPFLANPGYRRGFGLGFCLSDVSGDGRDDLMILRNLADGAQVYDLYLQDTNGSFKPDPDLVYTNATDWHTLAGWRDINRDGKLDLVKCTASDEPSFIPGLPSGKVLVAVYLAGKDGRIPDQPDCVFRKSDWSTFVPMPDLDNDGFPDLVLGDMPIDSRDQFRDIITAGRLELTLKFHFYHPGRGFLAEPDRQRNLRVFYDNNLDWSIGERFYFEKFVNLSGDFSGDGRKDLLVRDRSDAISVYFFQSRAAGFSARPDVEFPCPDRMDWWRVQDLNGDGVSDLVVKLRNRSAFRVFISDRK
jgi:hypothetical protein